MAAILARPTEAPPSDLISEALADDMIEALAEAGTEIFNACGSGNIVAARLRALRDRIQQAKLTDRVSA